jgi:pimeloyl-ACP methyl ester carboxylesterase
MNIRVVLSAVVVLPAALSIACVGHASHQTATSDGGSSGSSGGGSNADVGSDSGSGSCAAVSEVITVPISAGTLIGTLETPAGCGPHPLVFIIPGSGAVDQNGNESPILNANVYKDLAAAFLRSGIASVRYDKECIGKSACGNESTFTFDDDLADAQAVAEQYVHDARFTGLTLVGHSEGSLMALILAQRVPTVAVESLEGAGRPVGQVLSQQLASQFGIVGLLDPGLLEQANQIIASLEAGVPVPNVPVLLQPLLGPKVQPYLISWMKHDPAKEIAKLTQPVLIVQGTTDSQTSLADASLLAAADPSAKLLVIANMCHTLKDATPGPVSQALAYTDPFLPLDATLVAGTTLFVP